MKQSWLAMGVLLAIVIVGGSGCAAAAVGAAAGAGAAGAVAYTRGELKATENVKLEDAVTASRDALTDLAIPITSEEGGVAERKIVARGAEDQKISVNLKRLGPEITEVSIRVGTFGDEPLSRTIMQEMRQNLASSGALKSTETAAEEKTTENGVYGTTPTEREKTTQTEREKTTPADREGTPKVE